MHLNSSISNKLIQSLFIILLIIVHEVIRFDCSLNESLIIFILIGDEEIEKMIVRIYFISLKRLVVFIIVVLSNRKTLNKTRCFENSMVSIVHSCMFFIRYMIGKYLF